MARKAHGTAEVYAVDSAARIRLAGSFQTAALSTAYTSTAVLEQPSSRRMAQSALVRRNIALLETSELNAIGNALTLLPAARERKRRSRSTNE